MEKMRITDPNGIGLSVEALDIDLLDGETVRIWLTEQGLRIESLSKKRLHINVLSACSIDVKPEGP